MKTDTIAGLIKRLKLLKAIRDNDWRIAHLAYTSDTAGEAADALSRLTAELAECDKLAVYHSDRADKAEAALTAPVKGLTLETTEEERVAWVRRVDDAGRLARDYAKLTAPLAALEELAEAQNCIETMTKELAEAHKREIEDAITIGRLNSGKELQAVMAMHNETIARLATEKTAREAAEARAERLAASWGLGAERLAVSWGLENIRAHNAEAALARAEAALDDWDEIEALAIIRAALHSRPKETP